MLLNCVVDKRGRIVVVLLLLILSFGLFRPLDVVSGLEEEGPFIVKVAEGVDMAQVAADHEATLLSVVEPLSLCRLDREAAGLLDDLLADARVVSAEIDQLLDGRRRYFGAHGEDLLAPERRYFGAHEEALGAYQAQWAIDHLRADQAHAVATGQGVVVAVLDTGVDLDHPLLAGKLVSGYDFVEHDTVPDDVPNELNDDGDDLIDESTGHGTHVAGIVALAAPGASIMPVRVLDSDGRGTYFDAIEGIVYAVDQGAQVINLSASGPADAAALEEAVDYALENGVVFVASAAVNELEYPAAYDGVMAVGSSDENDYRMDFARFQGADPTVYAPGKEILSAYYDGGYAVWTGNSMATPFVSAEAALALSVGGCDTACFVALVAEDVRPVPNTALGRIDLYDAAADAAGTLDIDLKVAYQNGSAAQDDGQVMPVIDILNNGNTLPLSALKLRYWYTDEGEDVPAFTCDYAPFGPEHVTGQFYQMLSPVDGADHYLEVGFAEAAGDLLGGRSSGQMEIRFQVNDPLFYDESDDYSYDATKTELADWDHVTLYYGETPVWGTHLGDGTFEGLRLQYRSGDSDTDDSQIKPHFNVINATGESVPLSELTLRYWYTIDGEQEQTYACDYAEIGCGGVMGSFHQMDQPYQGADHYLQIGFSDQLGTIPAGGASGQIQARFHKADWGPYDRYGDYSFVPGQDLFMNWDHVTLYRNGQLVWGMEPGDGSEPTPTLTPLPTSPPSDPITTPTLPPPTPTPTEVPPATATPLPTETPASTPTPTPEDDTGACVVDYTIGNDWGSGATVSVEIINDGSAAIDGWTLAWSFSGDQQIADVWGAVLTQNSASVSVANESYNATIGPNDGSVSFGFNLSYSGSNDVPTAFTLNGMACDIQ